MNTDYNIFSNSTNPSEHDEPKNFKKKLEEPPIEFQIFKKTKFENEEIELEFSVNFVSSDSLLNANAQTTNSVQSQNLKQSSFHELYNPFSLINNDCQLEICVHLNKKDLISLHRASGKESSMRKTINSLLVKELNKCAGRLSRVLPGVFDSNMNSCQAIVDFFGESCSEINQLILSDFRNISDISALIAFTNLKSLCLRGLDKITDASILSNFKKLEMLVMPKCIGVNNFNFLKSLENVTYLDLSGCKQITDYGFGFNNTNLSGLLSCHKLKELHITNCQNFSGLEVLQNCKNLEYLYASDTNISDFSHLIYLQNIIWLEIQNHQLLDEDFVVLQLLPNLEVVKMPYLNLDFANQCSALKELYVFQNPKGHEPIIENQIRVLREKGIKVVLLLDTTLI